MSLRGVWLQSAARSDAHKLELADIVTNASGGEIYVCERVKFVDHNVDIVAPYPRGECRDAFSPVGSRNCAKLAAAHLAFHLFKMRGDKGNTSGISHKNYFFRQLLGTKMQVENTSIGVYYQLRGGDR